MASARDLYTVEMVDDVTPAALKIKRATLAVARAQNQLANAAARVNRVQWAGGNVVAARAAEKLARAQLGVAQSALKIANAAPKAAQGIGVLGVALGSLLAQGAMAGARGLSALASNMFSTASTIGEQKLALTAMLGSQEAANAEMAKGTRLARDYGFGVSDTIDQLRKFAGLGFTDAQRTALIQLQGDMRALGLGADALARVNLQLGQIAAKGKLQGEELIVLAENGISLDKIYTRLEHTLGKTRDEVLAMQKAGKIKSGDALNAIAQAVVWSSGGKSLGESGSRAAQNTVGGVIGRIGATFEAKWREAIDKGEGSLLESLKRLEKVAAGVNFEKVFAAGAKGLELMASAADSAGKALAWVDANGDTIKVALFGIAGALGAAAVGFVALKFAAIAAWAAAIAPILPFVAAAASVGVAIGMLVVYWEDVKEGLALIWRDITTDFFGTLGKIWDVAKEIFPPAMFLDWGFQLVKGLAQGIWNGIGAAVDAVKGVAQSVINAGKSTFHIQSPSRVFAEQGQMIDAGLARGIEQDADMAFTAARELSEGTVGTAERATATAAAPGGTLARAGERAGEVGAGGGSGAVVNIGDIYVQLLGGGAAGAAGEDAADAVRDWFETSFVDLLERNLQSVGA